MEINYKAVVAITNQRILELRMQFHLSIFLFAFLHEKIESKHIESTHLRQELQQTEHDERHCRRHRQTELHEGKVDADVAAADVNVWQQDDECDG